MTWWHYLLLVNFYLVLFFGFYTLLLRRETFFQLNRVYLVAASLLSFMIPLIQADWVKDLFITREMQQTIYSGPIAIAYNFAPAAQSSITLGEILNVVYIAVTLFLVLRLMWQLVILKKAIEKPSPSAAYSFFKKISLGKDISQSKIIADHEQVHAGQWHSVDVMIIETVMIINWFNPVVYLYRFAIKYIHEYIADREVIQAGTDKVDYAMLLLSQTFEVPTHRLVNPFYNHSLLKKRITMLQKDRSQRIALAKYGLSAPLFILMMIFSSATVNNSKAVMAINNKTEKVLLTPATEVATAITERANITGEKTKTATDTVPGDKIYSQVEITPQFPGGMEAFGKFIATNISYPAEDRTNKVHGKAIIQFVVEEDGTLSDIKALRAPSEAMGKEAIRVLSLSPLWIPGKQNGQNARVSYTVPINFTLDDQTSAPADKPAGGQQADDKVFSQVEIQPQFPGGLEALGKFLGMNVRYPKADRENGKQGKVLCSFVVEEDGSLSDITAIRTPSETLAKEAVRVLLLSPKWKPGVQNGHVVRVAYTLPVNFVLGDADEKKGKDTIITYTPKGATSPLYVLDGEVMKTQPGVSPLATIKQDDIASMLVLKDDEAVALYGEKGRNGVIVIVSKKAEKKPVLNLKDLKNALVLIDGKVTNISPDLIDMKKIASIEVLKADVATKLYGTKGKNGAVLIKTIK